MLCSLTILSRHTIFKMVSLLDNSPDGDLDSERFMRYLMRGFNYVATDMCLHRVRACAPDGAICSTPLTRHECIMPQNLTAKPRHKASSAARRCARGIAVLQYVTHTRYAKPH